jgi:hypothetical protein
MAAILWHKLQKLYTFHIIQEAVYGAGETRNARNIQGTFQNVCKGIGGVPYPYIKKDIKSLQLYASFWSEEYAS